MATPIDKVYSLTIGVQGENVARAIEFDMSAWVELYPDATLHVLFKPYNAPTASPMLSTFEDNILTWTPTMGATAVVGVGYTEIRALDPETGLIRKSRIIPTSVENSVSGTEADPPAPYQDWVDRVLKAGVDAVSGAAAVAAVAQGEAVAFEINEDGHLVIAYTEGVEQREIDLGPVDAYAVAVVEGYTGTREEWGRAIADAEANGLKAEGYAVGKQNGVVVESGEYHQNNAEYYNEQARSAKEDAETAQAAAETAKTAAEAAQASASASAAEAAQHTSDAVHTWLENNIDPTTGYALDRALTEPLAAAPADMVGDLKSAVTSLNQFTEVTMTKNAYIPTNIDPVDITDIKPSSAGYMYAIIDCSEGDVFTILNAHGGSTPLLWTFIDANNNRLQHSDANLGVSQIRIMAPPDSSKLIVNSNLSSTVLYKGTGSTSYILTNKTIDLNRLLNEGVYIIGPGNTLINFPEISGGSPTGILEVYRSTAGQGTIFQRYHQNITGRLYMRTIAGAQVYGWHSVASDGIQELNRDSESAVISAASRENGYGYSDKRIYPQLMVCTDIHSDWIRLNRALEYNENCQTSEMMLCLGDVSEHPIDLDDYDWATKVLSCTKPVLSIVGNHDVAVRPSGKKTDAQLMEYFFSYDLQTHNGEHHADDSLYWYKDIAKTYTSESGSHTKTLRVIALNQFEYPTDTDDYRSYIYYSQNQIDWLIDLLDNTPSDTYVLIVTHEAPAKLVVIRESVWSPTSKAGNYIAYEDSGSQGDPDMLLKIIKAWINNETVSTTNSQSLNGVNRTITVSHTFSNRQGMFVGWLCGHMHCDAYGYKDGYENQKIIVFNCAASYDVQQNSDIGRLGTGKTQDCVTMVSYDWNNDKIRLTRIGADTTVHGALRRTFEV